MIKVLTGALPWIHFQPKTMQRYVAPCLEIAFCSKKLGKHVMRPWGPISLANWVLIILPKGHKQLKINKHVRNLKPCKTCTSFTFFDLSIIFLWFSFIWLPIWAFCNRYINLKPAPLKTVFPSTVLFQYSTRLAVPV